jgi:hypothetical protein
MIRWDSHVGEDFKVQCSVGILTSRGKREDWLHPFWLGWMFALGFFSWIAFAYIGIKARHLRWTLWAVFYAVPLA